METMYRFFMYCLVGLTCEMVFSVIGINRALGYKVQRRVPNKYLEGFVSLFMVPIHGFGVLLVFEPLSFLFVNIHWIFRYIIWSSMFVFAEAFAGFVLDKVLGFYPWDYYADSKYRIFKRGYSLWTLLPLWGLYAMFLEVFVKIIYHTSSMISTIL